MTGRPPSPSLAPPHSLRTRLFGQGAKNFCCAKLGPCRVFVGFLALGQNLRGFRITRQAKDAVVRLEEKLGLRPIKVEGMVVLAMPDDPETPEQEAFVRALHHWYRNRRDFDEGELTPDEYFAWKDSFKA